MNYDQAYRKHTRSIWQVVADLFRSRKSWR